MSEFRLKNWDGIVAEGKVNEDGTVIVRSTLPDIDGEVVYESMEAVLVDYTDAQVLEVD